MLHWPHRINSRFQGDTEDGKEGVIQGNLTQDAFRSVSLSRHQMMVNQIKDKETISPITANSRLCRGRRITATPLKRRTRRRANFPLETLNEELALHNNSSVQVVDVVP